MGAILTAQNMNQIWLFEPDMLASSMQHPVLSSINKQLPDRLTTKHRTKQTPQNLHNSRD